MKRIEIIVTGRVQGVGYRGYSASRAAFHRITGFIENLSDGSVRIVAEGEDVDISLFLEDFTATEEPIIQVSNLEVTELPYVGEFDGFSVRYGEMQQELFFRSGLMIEYLNEMVKIQQKQLENQNEFLTVLKQQAEESVKRREVLERIIEAIHTQGLL